MERGDEILHVLKRRGALATAEVADALQVSRQAAAMFLGRLADDGLVETTEERRGGVGRPRQLWSLAAAANARFPDAHAELSLDLIGAVRDLFGEDGLDRLIIARETSSEQNYPAAMQEATSLADRVARLAEARAREGYMAEWSTDGDGFLLVENHCPICAAARLCQGFCRSELEVFRRVLGAGTRVERTDHILAGARRCAYWITPA